MLTVIGSITTKAGLVQFNDGYGGVRPMELAAASYQRRQRADIDLHFHHDVDWTIGSVLALERSDALGLAAVARIERDDLADLLEDGPWFFSAGVRCVPVDRHGITKGYAKINELSLVRSPASLGIAPVRWTRADIEVDDGGRPRDMSLYQHGTWDRVHQSLVGAKYRSAPTSMQIHDVDPLSFADEMRTDRVAALDEAERLVRAAYPSKPTPVATAASTDGMSRPYRHRFPSNLTLT
ncbi:hypothetical protein BH10ACT3_BH10ACT3_20680 [soil metagenome]